MFSPFQRSLITKTDVGALFRGRISLLSQYFVFRKPQGLRVCEKSLHTGKVQQAAETNCEGRINSTVSFVVQLFAGQ